MPTPPIGSDLSRRSVRHHAVRVSTPLTVVPRTRPVERPEPGTVRGGTWAGKLLALGVVAVGVGAALFIDHAVQDQTPYARATAATPLPRPTDAHQALTDVLRFAPSGTGSSGLVVSAGVPIRTALAQATGLSANLPATRLDPHVLRIAGGAYDVTLRVPVQVAALARQGLITSIGSDVRAGELRVSYDGRVVYALRINPATHVAVFRFQLGASGQTLMSLNWNAMALITQTDSSDTLGF